MTGSTLGGVSRPGEWINTIHTHKIHIKFSNNKLKMPLKKKAMGKGGGGRE